jgi:cytochrome c oxidase subunit 2
MDREVEDVAPSSKGGLTSVVVAIMACRATGTHEGAVESQTGQETFEDMGCGACHVEAAGMIAPPLAGLFGAPVSLEGGETILADDAYIRESVLFPQRRVVIRYDPVMPPYERRIGDEQLAGLVEYIKSLGEEG